MLFVLLFTSVAALRMRLALMVFLMRWLRLGLRLGRPGFWRTLLRLRLRRVEFRRARLGLGLRWAHLHNVWLRRRTRGFHVLHRRTLLGLRACTHLRRLVVRALLHRRGGIAVEAIRLLATALRLRLRLRCWRGGLRQLRARLEGATFVTRCTGCAVVLWWARRHPGRALRCLSGLRLPRALLRCGCAGQRAWAIDRTGRHQRLRTSARLSAVRCLCTLRVRRTHQPLRTIRTIHTARTVLLRRTTLFVPGACGLIGYGTRQT